MIKYLLFQLEEPRNKTNCNSGENQRITAPKQQPRYYFETRIHLKQNNPIFEKLILLKSGPCARQPTVIGN